MHWLRPSRSFRWKKQCPADALYTFLCLMDRLIDGRWMIHALFAAIDLKPWIATVTGIFQHMTGGGLILTGNGKRQCEQILGRAKIRKYHVLFMQTIYIYIYIYVYYMYIYICIYYICIYFICIYYICIYCLCICIYIYTHTLVFSFYIYIYVFFIDIYIYIYYVYI